MKVIGLGAGGHARVMLEIVKLQKEYELVGLLDADTSLYGTKVDEVPVIGGDEMLPDLREQGVGHAFVGVGAVNETRSRQRLWKTLLTYGFEIIQVVHPNALVSSSSDLGRGSTIMAGAIVSVHVRLGDNVIINTGAIVDHDCLIGSHVHIGPGARLAGDVKVEDGALLGIGCAILPGVDIGRDAVVGAGAVVTENVPDSATVVGVPAKRLRR